MIVVMIAVVVMIMVVVMIAVVFMIMVVVMMVPRAVRRAWNNWCRGVCGPWIPIHFRRFCPLSAPGRILGMTLNAAGYCAAEAYGPGPGWGAKLEARPIVPRPAFVLAPIVPLAALRHAPIIPGAATLRRCG